MTDVNYKNTLSDDVKHLIKWKNEFPRSHIIIVNLDDNCVHISLDDNAVTYWFIAKSLTYDKDNNNIVRALENINTNDIYSVLTHIESYISNIVPEPKKKSPKRPVTSEYVMMSDDDDEGEWSVDNDDTYMFCSVENIVSKIRSAHPGIIITTAQNVTISEINIRVKVLQTSYTFILCINDNKLKMPIKFEGTHPTILFKYLLSKLKLCDDGVDFEQIIIYIADALTNDIEPCKQQKLNINKIMIDLYNLHDIILDDYIWKSPSSICPLNIPLAISTTMLESLTQLKHVMSGNRNNLKQEHMYDVYPIMMYYLSVTSVDHIINNISHYVILKQIIELLWTKYKMEIDTSISIMIELCDDEVSDEDATILNFYKVTFAM